MPADRRKQTLPNGFFFIVHRISMYKILYALAVQIKILYEGESSGRHLTAARLIQAPCRGCCDSGLDA